MSSYSSSSSAAPAANLGANSSGYPLANSSPPLQLHSGGHSASLSGSSWVSPPPEGKGEEGVPRPFEALHGPSIPPFLSKTYDLVDDPALDPVISWGPRWTSFVIWDPAQFSKDVLPRHFKHNNFSSFVRQLNTYGFRKIDPDRWEFAHEEFRRGNKLLLKSIIRRRSCQVHQMGVRLDTSSEMESALQGEIDLLRSEKSALKEEITILQQEQLKTLQQMDVLNERMQTVEQRQKQMVSFLGKVLQNPAFMARLRQKKEQRQITSPRARRKFLKHNYATQTASIRSMDDNSAKNISGSSTCASSSKQQYTEGVSDRELPGMVEKLGLEKIPQSLITDSFGSEFIISSPGHSSMEQLPLDPDVPVHETLASDSKNLSLKGKIVVTSSPDVAPGISEYLVSFPEDTCDDTYTRPADEIAATKTKEEFWKDDPEIGQECFVSQADVWDSLLPYSFDLDVAAGLGTLWDFDLQDAREGFELDKSMNANFSLKEHQSQAGSVDQDY